MRIFGIRMNTMKPILPFLILLSFLLFSCESSDNKPASYVSFNGQTMGTTYTIKAKGLDKDLNKAIIDKVLIEVNQSVSTYIEDSEISLFNQSDKGMAFPTTPKGDTPFLSKHLLTNLEASFQVYQNTSGYFDPTCMPLVNYWGFGYEAKKAITQVDSQKITEMLGYVGLEQITATPFKDSLFIAKKDPKSQLDFSAIAKGYAVDLIHEMLLEHGSRNHMIEIGGETRCYGKSPSGDYWKIGINTPDPYAALSDFEEIVSLKNKSLASSGNYRNFHEVDGVRYGHEIDPKTGYPSENTLLSVSIIANDCMSADAYATACMVMGLEKAKTLVEATDGMEALFIIGGKTQLYELVKTSGF